MAGVAALYVDVDRGPYRRLGCDCWGITRDARLYPGPLPVVAHPPCERWGRYWNGGPSARTPRHLGDDGGCFAHAWESVRRWGGVLEHPEGSHAWRVFGLRRPKRGEGWVQCATGGWTCCVAQSQYGHPARKLTWLYAFNPAPPFDLDVVPPFDLDWTLPEPGTTARLDRTNGAGVFSGARLPGSEAHITPDRFAAVLIRLAQGDNWAERRTE